MKTRLPPRALLLAALLALTFGTGCFEMSNTKRVVRRQVMTLQAYLSQNAFDKATAMYTADFVWLSGAKTAAPGAKTGAPGAKTAAPGAKTAAPGAKTAAPGAKTGAPGAKTGGRPDAKAKPKSTPTSATAFHESIQQIPSRTAVFIHQERIQQLGENEVIVIGSFQVRSADSTSLGNTQWEYSMTWVKVGDTWKVKEIKERSARRHAKS